MLVKSVTIWALAAAGLMGTAVLPGASTQAASVNRPAGYTTTSWSPVQNIKESERYDRLIATDSAFRHARERIECAPITDPVLYQRCLQSFQREVQAWYDGELPHLYQTALNRWATGSVAYGSSTPPVNYPTGAGQ